MLTCMLLVFLPAMCVPLTDAASVPNIFFILADDLGYGDLGVYPNPSSPHGRIATPNIDALSKESLMFTDAYAGSTVCAPSRCALMTGRHTGHCTVRQNGEILNNTTDVTVASVLRKAGYHTGMIGKWGLGYGNSSTSPNGKGFDYFYGYIDQEHAHDYYPSYLWLNNATVNIKENENASRSKCGSPLTSNCVWSQDLFVSETLSFLKNASKDDKPFYLFLSFTTPHAGGVGTDAESGVPAPYELPQYKNQSWPMVERDFASVISIQDQQVGEVLKALDTFGLTDNTVVFYASDNGAHNEGGHNYMFFESSGPLRGYKRSLHEGGVRSPLLVRWPGVTQGGEVSDQQWGFWDFLTTAADLANVPASSLPPNLDGYSLVPTLKGEKQSQPKYIYHEYCYPLEDHSGWGQALRFDKWKAVRYDFSQTVELYDLSSDIGEKTDVSDKYFDEVQMAVQYMDQAHSPGPVCIPGLADKN